tara:strand:- start:313 stop:456 length:144 start_codon:yes stop_codon:yes gene_type:complete
MNLGHLPSDLGHKCRHVIGRSTFIGLDEVGVTARYFSRPKTEAPTSS